ncbi:hypothetical protein [Chryseolinea sp. H1M3-3]|uniref:hypothetical protein n=1 Tax=Chryseolinea sp. H1M3-3 TaxID=3034144 RepID=UPI0023EAFEB7|nr:hypothetical protein [Chryseolinea sp. H1M3-3]
MAKQRTFLYRTNYFRREWTWIRRIFAILFLGLGALILPLEKEVQFVKFVGVGLVVFYFVAKPKDDLALTDEQLLHIKKSAINWFTRIDQYDIAELISIRCGGIHTDGWELVDFFNGSGNQGGYYNTIEMTFRNGESKSLQLSIDRKKLDFIVKIIYDLKKRTKP